MIVITKIETIETHEDWIEFAHLNLPQLKYVNPGEFLSDKEYFIRELVRGRRFRKPNGEEIIIGITNQASEILGILYESYDNMNQVVEENKYFRYQCQTKLLNLTGWIKIPLWQKLYWLIFDCVRYENRKPKL